MFTQIWYIGPLVFKFFTPTCVRISDISRYLEISEVEMKEMQSLIFREGMAWDWEGEFKWGSRIDARDPGSGLGRVSGC